MRRNDNNKEKGDENVTMLVTASGDEMRVCDVLLKKCVMKINAKRWHERGEIVALAKEKREKGSFFSAGCDGVLCLWRLNNSNKSSMNSNNNSNNNSAEPEYAYAFISDIFEGRGKGKKLGITALASMDEYDEPRQKKDSEVDDDNNKNKYDNDDNDDDTKTFITAVGFDSGDVAVHAYRPGGYKERVFVLEKDERVQRSPISSLEWVFVDATKEIYLAVGNRTGDLFFCLLSKECDALERIETLTLLNTGTTINNNIYNDENNSTKNKKNENNLATTTPCWMNFASLRKSGSEYPLMMCSIRGELTKVSFDVEKFTTTKNERNQEAATTVSFVGLKTERATIDFSGHKKLGFSLKICAVDANSTRIVTHGIDRTICFYDIIHKSHESGDDERMEGKKSVGINDEYKFVDQISTLGGFIYDIDHAVLPGIGDWTIFACGDGTLRKMENIIPSSIVPNDIVTFDRKYKTEIIFRADKQRKITSCRFYFDRERLTRCVVIGLDDGTVGIMRVEKANVSNETTTSGKLTKEEKKVRFFAQKHRGAVIQILAIPSLDGGGNIIATLSENGELWYWRRLTGFFDDQTDTPEPYFDVSRAIREEVGALFSGRKIASNKDIITRFANLSYARGIVLVGFSNGFFGCFERTKESFKVLWSDTNSHSTEITDIKCNQTGEYISNCNVAIATASSDGCVFVRAHAEDCAPSEFVGKITHVIPRARQSVTRLEWLRDETAQACLACANADGLVRVFSVNDAKSSEVSLHAVLRGHRGRIRALCKYVSHSNTENGILLTGSDDQTIRVSDVDDFLRSPDMGNQCAIYEKEKPPVFCFTSRKNNDNEDFAKQPFPPIAAQEEERNDVAAVEVVVAVEVDAKQVEKEKTLTIASKSLLVNNNNAPLKPSKAQSLFKTEPWESTAKGAEVSESKALELLLSSQHNFVDEDDDDEGDKSDAHYAYGPEGNALFEKPESTRKMLEIMRVKSRKEEEERKKQQNNANRKIEFQFLPMRPAEKRASMAMYADDWNGAAYELFSETDGPVHSDLFATILSSGGRELFDLCQNEQANRFIDRQEYQRAALCFLSQRNSFNLSKAVQCLLDGNLPRDACALATSRLPKNHELCSKCYRALATFEEQRGANGAAAKSHIAANRLKNAIRSLARRGQFGCYAAAMCAFAMFRQDQNNCSQEELSAATAWYSTDDSYEQNIVLNALIDHSLCDENIHQDLRAVEVVAKEYKFLCDETDFFVATLCSKIDVNDVTNKKRMTNFNEREVFQKYPIVRQFWYIECYTTIVKMTFRCLTKKGANYDYEKQRGIEYFLVDELLQYVHSFLETESARNTEVILIRASDEYLTKVDEQVWNLIFKRGSLFENSLNKIVRFAMFLASVLVSKKRDITKNNNFAELRKLDDFELELDDSCFDLGNGENISREVLLARARELWEKF